MARGAARAHQVGGHHRLAVAGRQGVQGPPGHREEDGERHDTHREVVVEQAVERALRGLRHRAVGVVHGRRDGAGAGSGVPGEAAARHVDRALEQPSGVGAQLVGHVLRTGRRVGDPRPARRADDELVPAEPVAVTGHIDRHAVVAVGHVWRAGGAIPGRVAQRAQAALPGQVARRLRDRLDGEGPAVDRQGDLARPLGRARRGVGLEPAGVVHRGPLAEGRDLGHVDDLAEIQLAAAGLDPQVGVDREVAERVRAGRARQEQGEARDGDQGRDDAPHDDTAASSLAGDRRPAHREVRVERQGARQALARHGGPAGARGGHAGVEQHQRVARARAAGCGWRSGRPPRSARHG